MKQPGYLILLHLLIISLVYKNVNAINKLRLQKNNICRFFQSAIESKQSLKKAKKDLSISVLRQTAMELNSEKL